MKSNNERSSSNTAVPKYVCIVTKDFLFNNKNLQVLLFTFDCQYWFWLKEVSKILKIDDINNAIDILDDDELLILGDVPEEQHNDKSIINESGLFRLIFTSQQETPNEFKRWISQNVLPSISHGGWLNFNKRQNHV